MKKAFLNELGPKKKDLEVSRDTLEKVIAQVKAWLGNRHAANVVG